MKDLIKRELSNGIKVYMYPSTAMKRFIAVYSVAYGSNGYYDKFYYKDKPYHMNPAMAHFIEHTLIEESKYGNMLHRYKDKNYEINGLTYPELTSYYLVGIKDFEESLKELIHMVDDPAFSKEAIENVKGAIVDEVLKNEDSKYQIGFNVNRRNTFKNYEVVSETHNSLGSKASTEAITYEDVVTCYDAYYNDENKFLIIGGNFDENKMIEYLEEIYKEIKPHPNFLLPFNYSDEFDVRCEYEEIEKPVDEDMTIVTYKLKNDFSISNLKASLYLDILASLKFSIDTDFMESLSKDNICEKGAGISCTPDFSFGTIAYMFNAFTKNSKEFVTRLDKELKEKEFDEDRFELLKKSFKVSSLQKLENIYYYLRSHAQSLLTFSEKLFDIDEIDELNIEEFKTFISSLDFSIKTVTVIKKMN